ncbi:MAG TPA: helix-turn-helix domain-containing protein [Methylomirabilota bacterium]|nr:helix-turn-helix domain-containing protein [Methylomirabilota bacterium]
MITRKDLPKVGANVQPGDILDEETLAKELAVEPRTLRVWRQTRGLPHIRVTARIIRYKRSEVYAWLDRHRVCMTA